jgi:hypothetical protein
MYVRASLSSCMCACAHLECAHERLGRGRVHKVKVHEVVNAELLQLQHHRAQIGPQDLRVRVLLQLLLVCLFRIQAEGCGPTRPRLSVSARVGGASCPAHHRARAFARSGAAGAASTLLRTRLGDGRHQQRLNTNARIVHLRPAIRSVSPQSHGLRVCTPTAHPPTLTHRNRHRHRHTYTHIHRHRHTYKHTLSLSHSVCRRLTFCLLKPGSTT